MLFMGQEFAASSPFPFFSHLGPELGPKVTEGRRTEFGAFEGFSGDAVPDPQAESTFDSAKLKLDEREAEPGASVWALYRELLRVRRELQLGRASRDGMVANPRGDQALEVQLPTGHQLLLNLADEPLSQETVRTRSIFSSQAEPRVANGRVTVPPRTAVLLAL
jgi:maltooligosyltrehalose trehalohydrolase